MSDLPRARVPVAPPWRWAGQKEPTWEETAENLPSVRSDDSELPLRARLLRRASTTLLVRGRTPT